MIFQLIFLQIVTLVVIILILRRIFSSHINSTLSNLQALYQDNLQRQEVLNEEIAKAKTFREQEIARVRQEAEAILEQARKKAQGKEEEVIANAQNQAKDFLDRANLQLEKNQAEMLERMQAKAVEVGQQAVAYVLSDNSKHILQEALINELLEQFKDMKLPENIRAEKGALRVEVISACALPDTYKQKIKELIVKASQKTELEMDFKLDQGIIGGLVLNFRGRVVDGSLGNRLRQAVALIKEKNRILCYPWLI